MSTYARLGASYPNMMTGIFFFFIIATEFFINYKILSTHHFKKKKDLLADDQDATGEAETPAETDSEATDGVEPATLALENTKEVE